MREASFVVGRSVDGLAEFDPFLPASLIPILRAVYHVEIWGHEPVASRAPALLHCASVGWAMPFITCVAMGIKRKLAFKTRENYLLVFQVT